MKHKAIYIAASLMLLPYANAGELIISNPYQPQPKIIYIDTFKHGQHLLFKHTERDYLFINRNQCREGREGTIVPAYGLSVVFERDYQPKNYPRSAIDSVKSIVYPSCNGRTIKRDTYIDAENYNLYIKFPNFTEDIWFKFEMNITKHRRNETHHRWIFDMIHLGPEYSDYFIEAYPSYGSAHLSILKRGCLDVTKQENEAMTKLFSSPIFIYENPDTKKLFTPLKKIDAREFDHILITENNQRESHLFYERYSTDLLTTCYAPD